MTEYRIYKRMPSIFTEGKYSIILTAVLEDGCLARRYCKAIAEAGQEAFAIQTATGEAMFNYIPYIPAGRRYDISVFFTPDGHLLASYEGISWKSVWTVINCYGKDYIKYTIRIHR